MSILMLLLLAVIALINLGCFIVTLIRVFSREGLGLGLLGLFCGIYTYWWGWTHVEKPNDRLLMTVWTIGIAVSVLLKFALRLGMHS